MPAAPVAASWRCRQRRRSRRSVCAPPVTARPGSRTLIAALASVLLLAEATRRRPRRRRRGAVSRGTEGLRRQAIRARDRIVRGGAQAVAVAGDPVRHRDGPARAGRLSAGCRRFRRVHRGGPRRRSPPGPRTCAPGRARRVRQGQRWRGGGAGGRCGGSTPVAGTQPSRSGRPGPPDRAGPGAVASPRTSLASQYLLRVGRRHRRARHRRPGFGWQARSAQQEAEARRHLGQGRRPRGRTGTHVRSVASTLLISAGVATAIAVASCIAMR